MFLCPSQLDILCNEEILGKDHTLKFVVVTRWRFKVLIDQIFYSLIGRSDNESLEPLQCEGNTDRFNALKKGVPVKCSQ